MLSDDQFTVDGTLPEAWASLKSIHPKDDGSTPKRCDKNPEVDFRGEQRTNDAHQSSTDPEARLYKATVHRMGTGGKDPQRLQEEMRAKVWAVVAGPELTLMWRTGDLKSQLLTPEITRY